jgi:hypothetical protein
VLAGAEQRDCRKISISDLCAKALGEKDSAASRPLTSLDILDGISDHPRTWQVDLVILRSPQ